MFNICFLLLCLSSFLATNNAALERRLAGSNCILIQRGIVPPYYDCVGCEIEEATGCIHDMRHNKSKNVLAACRMTATSEKYNREYCCPRFEVVNQRYDLSYLGSAYPEALRCIERTGCKSSTIYAQLEQECLAICTTSDVRDGKSVCYSDFNSALSNKVSAVLSVVLAGLTVFVMSALS